MRNVTIREYILRLKFVKNVSKKEIIDKEMLTMDIRESFVYFNSLKFFLTTLSIYLLNDQTNQFDLKILHCAHLVVLKLTFYCCQKIF